MTSSPRAFDLVVLGGGPAGTSGALVAAAFGRTAALVERAEHLGGAGINTGTVPSKTLRESALLLSGWRSRRLLGVDVTVRKDTRLRDFTYHSQQVTSGERLELEHRFRQRGIEVVHGRARFEDPHTIAVEGVDGTQTRLRGEVILVATGSSPLRPEAFPFDHPRVHDSNQILEIVQLPKRLAVVGAGVVGSEYACTFTALGVEVHLIDRREALLPFLDSDVAAALQRAMEANGTRFHLGERVVRCEVTSNDEVMLHLAPGEPLVVTDVLVAAGRSSNTAGLDLDRAGVVTGLRGRIEVDEHYATCVPHIYAAGDVIGHPALAGTSMEQAREAVCHAFGVYPKESSKLLPTGIYTIPEVSMVGETERSLQEQGRDYVVGLAPYTLSPRGRIIGDPSGFLKLLFLRENMRLLGVHVLGEQASEVVHIGLVAMHAGADVELFSRICFNYPTLGDLYKYAAYDAILKRGRA